MVKCFKCEKEMESAGVLFGEDVWEMPSGGVEFEGGSNFGSRIYDSFVDGVYVQLIVCDDCLTTHKKLTRNFKIEKGRDKKVVINDESA